MKKLISISLIFCSLSSFAQKFKISGTVKYGTNKIYDATVLLQAQNIISQTNKKGAFVINGLKQGIYIVTVFAYGFETIKKEVKILNQNVTLNFDIFPFEEQLNEVVIKDKFKTKFGIRKLASVEGVTINEAKKSEVIQMKNIIANKATNNARQVYSRIAGLNIWESDGAGVQLGIGGRGLSPNRSSNFNVRQNSYDISADALGYPESYYTPPIFAVDRIEIIRGAASLQYGTQFGGLVNFVLHDGSKEKKLKINSIQTVGSFGFFNTFNSFGGTIGKLQYYTYYDYKRANGWRPNSDLKQHTAFATASVKITENTKLKLEYTFTDYVAQQAGGLTDNEFNSTPRTSKRERNWFTVNWNLFALVFEHSFSNKLKINIRNFGLIASRDALGNLGRIDRIDNPNENRDLLKDNFKNWGNETRLIYNYKIGTQMSILLVGSRFYNGFTIKKQGIGSAGYKADFEYLNPSNLEGSNYELPSKNISLFAENIFNIIDKLSITPGVRFEYIKTSANGFYKETLTDLAGNILLDKKIDENKRKSRSFLFGGIGISYKKNENTEIYANFSQNYRAINFNDIRISIPSLSVDENMTDEKGYNLDIGLRGHLKSKIQYDVSTFLLSYESRIGTTGRIRADPKFKQYVPQLFRFRTNIADASIYGIEMFLELNLLNSLKVKTKSKLHWFVNLALLKSAYTKSQTSEVKEGNEVELVPPINFKSGLTFKKKKFISNLQFSYIHQHYSDASNADNSPTSVEGLIPTYYVIDISFKYAFNKLFIQAGSNNLTDNKYFTRRASGYPGPGIIPSDGRNFYLTLGINL